MDVLVVGLNHRSAPVELRERLSLSGDGLRAALAETMRKLPVQEAAILSTCNRLELYLVSDSSEGLDVDVGQFLAARAQVDPAELAPTLYAWRGVEAARHLFRVAAGLDSQILGEPQILGQVREAFQTAQEVGVTGKVLSTLFRSALHAGKRVRNETAISRATTSVSHAAVELALSRWPREHGAPRILLVGAGEMVRLALKALLHRQIRHLGFVNRTLAHAQRLAASTGGRVFPWSCLSEALLWADVVISGTGAPHTVIDVGDVTTVLPARQGRPLVFVDMAVPRDVDPALDAVPGVVRLDIDDLQATLDANLARRRAAIPAAEAIIEAELREFAAWLRSQEAVPLIRTLREQIREMAQDELALALRQLPDLTAQEQAVVEKLVHRLVNKFLHLPTTQLRQAAAHKDGAQVLVAAAHLFGLDAPSSPNVNGSAKAKGEKGRQPLAVADSHASPAVPSGSPEVTP